MLFSRTPSWAILTAVVLTHADAQTITFSEQTDPLAQGIEHAPGLFDEPAGFMSAGGAVGDFNRDGRLDLFVLATGAGPDRLLIANPQGTFDDRSEQWGLAGETGAHMGLGVAVADVDADGLLDLFITSHGPGLGADRLTTGHHRLYRNVGGERFEDIAAWAGVSTTSTAIPSGMSAAFGDIDNDNDLDLFVTGWRANAFGNRLFRNRGNGQFDDVTGSAIGFDVLNGVRGFTPRFADMDDDGWQDLLIAGDFGTSRYLANDGDGTFTDHSSEAGTGLEGNAMGSVIADLDNDGRLDWYVTSIFDGPQSPPRPWDPPTHVDGNMLYLATDTPHRFGEHSLPLGVRDGRWGWGVIAPDLDHDGDADLIAVNGWYGADWTADPARVYRNDGAVFTDVAPECGLLHEDEGRGVLNADLDNDGDQDVVIFTNNGPLRIYRNELDDPTRHWTRVTIDATGAQIPPDGVGATVTVLAGGVLRRAQIDASSNFLAQSEMAAHLGLDAAATIDELTVRWGGQELRFSGPIPADRGLRIRACPCEFDGVADASPVLDLLAFVGLYLGPLDPAGPFDGSDVSGDGRRTVSDLHAAVECTVFRLTKTGGGPCVDH